MFSGRTPFYPMQFHEIQDKKSPEYRIPVRFQWVKITPVRPWGLCRRHVQQVEATDCAFAAVANHGIVAWGLPHSGGRQGRAQVDHGTSPTNSGDSDPEISQK